MNRAGEYVSNLNGEASYKSFRPSSLPPEPALNIDSNMVSKLVEANRELVKLDTTAKLIPNTNLLFRCMLEKKHSFLLRLKEHNALLMMYLTLKLI